MSAIQEREHIKRPDYSQCGEGGVVEMLLPHMPSLSKVCVEVGAGDGITLSNTRHLIERYGYSAVLIECDSQKFHCLKVNAEAGTRVLQVRAGWQPGRRIDDLDIPADCDFISIDVDGNDYHIWEAMTVCRPKIVCIEYNPTIPNAVRFIQPADESLHYGASIRSLTELGKSKGYELVATTGVNAIFVDRAYVSLVGSGDNSVEMLRPDADLVTYLFVGYDGRVFTSGMKRSPWNEDLRFDLLQFIPRWLQKLELTRFERWIVRMLMKWGIR